MVITWSLINKFFVIEVDEPVGQIVEEEEDGAGDVEGADVDGKQGSISPSFYEQLLRQ